METGMNLYGGALQVHYLLKGLAGVKGVNSALVCPRHSGIARVSRDHVPSIHEISMKGDLDLLFIPRLVKIVREEKPDLIHLHSRRGADILGGVAARFTGTPCILTRRVDNPEKRSWAGIKYRLYDRVITISEEIRKILINEGVPPEKVTCVRSAVDSAPYGSPCDRPWFLKEFGLEATERTCGVVAQLIERKGHKYLFQAIPGILKAVPDVSFLIFGKGPLEKELQDMCRDLDITQKVKFAGFREDMDRILGCLDLMVHPALMEGLGVSLLQASAARVPLVATRTGGIPEIVRDNINGCLVPPGSTPLLEQAAVRILLDADLSRRMGEAGRELVKEHFSIRSMMEGNLSVYREMTDIKS